MRPHSVERRVAALEAAREPVEHQLVIWFAEEADKSEPHQRLSEFIALAQLCSGVGWNIVHLTDFELMTLVELLEAAQRDAIKARRVIDR